MNFVTLRDIVHASKLGHSVEFKKGVPTYVPPALHNEVMAIGAVPEDEADLQSLVAAQDQKKEAINEPTEPTERKAAVFAAFEKIVLGGKREDFTSGGAPHGKAITEITGWPLPSKERDQLWPEFQQLKKD